MSECRPTVAEIDLDACVANLAAIRSAAPGLAVWAVVKADAYGHGAARVGRRLEAAGAEGFCVATASEGRELRRAGISRPILVLGPLSSGGARDPFAMALKYGLAVSVGDLDTYRSLSAAAGKAGIGPASVHLKVDTGMGRLGVSPEGAVGLARQIAQDKALSLDGLLSNLATADALEGDDPAHGFVGRQLDLLALVVGELRRAGLLPAVRTIANSAAAEHHPGSVAAGLVTGIRPGIALYGATLTPSPERLRLGPVMRLVTRVVAFRDLPGGASVGYGMATTTRRPTRVAVLPLGYHDGLPRSLVQGQVSLRGRRVPILGRVSMDITLIDATDVSAARPGDEVIIFGDSRLERQPVRVEDVAVWAGTIPHEILCRIGSRVPRRYMGDGAPPPEGPAT